MCSTRSEGRTLDAMKNTAACVPALADIAQIPVMTTIDMIAVSLIAQSGMTSGRGSEPVA